MISRFVLMRILDRAFVSYDTLRGQSHHRIVSCEHVRSTPFPLQLEYRIPHLFQARPNLHFRGTNLKEILKKNIVRRMRQRSIMLHSPLL